MNAYGFFGLFKTAAVQWWNDNAFRLAASVAFYTIFSLAPVILICLGIAGAIFGEEQATRHLVAQVEELVGPRGGQAVKEVAGGLGPDGGGIWAALLGGFTMLLGSTAVFADLQTSLNQIWRVEPNPRYGLLAGFVRDRILSFALVLTVGFLLLVSLVASAVLAMLIRDRRIGTNHHRHGALDDPTLPALPAPPSSYAPSEILECISASALAFDSIAAQLSSDYQPRRQPLLDFVTEARSALEDS